MFEGVAFPPPASPATTHTTPTGRPNTPAPVSTAAVPPQPDTHRPQPDTPRVGSTASRLNSLRHRPGSHVRPRTPRAADSEPVVLRTRDQRQAMFKMHLTMQLGGLAVQAEQDWKRWSDGIGDGAMQMLGMVT
jgi:hypothetical protein